MGGAEPIDARSHLTNGWDVDFPTDRRCSGRSGGKSPGTQRHPVLKPDARHCCLLPCQYFPTGRLRCCKRAWRVHTHIVARWLIDFSDSDADAGENLVSDVSTPTVFIATPMYGGMAAGIYTVSMVQLPAIFLRNRVDSLYAFTSSESLVPNARNVLTHQFLESQATHLMWIDSDIGFNATDIVSMLIADRDIVCGIYPKKEVDWARWRKRSRRASRRKS